MPYFSGPGKGRFRSSALRGGLFRLAMQASLVLAVSVVNASVSAEMRRLGEKPGANAFEVRMPVDRVWDAVFNHLKLQGHTFDPATRKDLGQIVTNPITVAAKVMTLRAYMEKIEITLINSGGGRTTVNAGVIRYGVGLTRSGVNKQLTAKLVSELKSLLGVASGERGTQSTRGQREGRTPEHRDLDIKGVIESLNPEAYSRQEIKEFWGGVRGRTIAGEGKVHSVQEKFLFWKKEEDEKQYDLHIHIPGLKSEMGYNVILQTRDYKKVPSLKEGDLIVFRGALAKFKIGLTVQETILVVANGRIE